MKPFTFLKASALVVALCCVTETFAAMVDRSFRPGTGIVGGDEEGANVVVPLADGRIMVGGDFDRYNGVSRPNLLRLHENGSLDKSIHLPGGVDAEDEPAIYSIGFQPDGKIIVAGNFNSIGGVAGSGGV